MANRLTDSMLDKVDYSGVGSVCYSDVAQESYKKSAEFLGADNPVEDWGCGTAWSKKYFKNYKGIDGSYHPNVDVVADLVSYKSSVDNILMRQALEFNPEWRTILDNVKKSFNKKFCLVICTPFVDTTRVGSTTKVIDLNGVESPDRTITGMYFKKQDILDCFPAPVYKVSEETIVTEQYYNQDWILYVEKV